MMIDGNYVREYVVEFPDGSQETYREFGSLVALKRDLRARGIDTDELRVISSSDKF